MKTNNEFTTTLPETIKVRISKTLDQGKWRIRVHGVTSGFIVHTSEDDSTIEFCFDASRYEPIIVRD